MAMPTDLNCKTPLPVNSIVRAFLDIEKDLAGFLDRVPLVPEHEHVWSPALASCILEACSQLDSFWKASSPVASKANMQRHFLRFGNDVANRWLVVWGDEPKRVIPFSAWPVRADQVDAAYVAPAWWSAYNELKHDRWANIRSARLDNAVNAVSALFLAIVRSPECTDALVAAGWLHSAYAIPYAVERMFKEGEHPEVGVTFETSTLAYASGSSHPEFQRYLVCYRESSHRFGRWLESQYGRGIIS